jgi:hypothetical protein
VASPAFSEKKKLFALTFWPPGPENAGFGV